MAAIFVLFLRHFRKPAWRPFRGFLFSFMASSAFYPIIYGCFLNGCRQMDIEAGATPHALINLLYFDCCHLLQRKRNNRRRVLNEC